jgi:hypothetical protein
MQVGTISPIGGYALYVNFPSTAIGCSIHPLNKTDVNNKNTPRVNIFLIMTLPKISNVEVIYKTLTINLIDDF